MSHYQVQQRKRGTFYDDYENDCNELWDAIEKLQEEVKRLRAMLMLMNGIITKKEERM